MGTLGAEWIIKDDGGFVDNRKPEGYIINNDTLKNEAFKSPKDNAANDPVPLTIPPNTIRFESPDGDVTTVPADRFYLPNNAGTSVSDEALFMGALMDAKGSRTKTGTPSNLSSPYPSASQKFGVTGKQYILRHFGANNNRQLGEIQPISGPVTYGGLLQPVEPDGNFFVFIGANGNPPPAPNSGEFQSAGFKLRADGYPKPKFFDILTGKEVKPDKGNKTFSIGIGSGNSSAASIASGMPGYPGTETGGIPDGIADATLTAGITGAGEAFLELDSADSGDSVDTVAGSGQVNTTDAGSGQSKGFELGVTSAPKQVAGVGTGSPGTCPDVDLTPVLYALALLQQLAEKIYAVEGGDAWTA